MDGSAQYKRSKTAVFSIGKSNRESDGFTLFADR